MVNKLYFLTILLFFSSCMSRQKLALIEQELADIRGLNTAKKSSIKNYKDSQIVFSDSLKHLRGALQKLNAHKTAALQLAKFKSDSLLIEKCTFATRVEKDVYHYLNYARTRPKEFCEKFVVPEWNKSNRFENSLVATMRSMAPVDALLPDFSGYQSAECHARSLGLTGGRGHKRIKDPKTGKPCEQNFWGECCSYGEDSGLGVVLQLLIDNGVESLGHREICLSNEYSRVGISLQYHKVYGANCVLDFL